MNGAELEALRARLLRRYPRGLVVTGRIVTGVGDFRKRMTRFPDVFAQAAGEPLFPGTLNVQVSEQLPIIEHFRVLGRDIGEEHQDLVFEVCEINGIWAYRIRPYDRRTGGGGHGDHVLEIASAQELRPTLSLAPSVEIRFFR